MTRLSISPAIVAKRTLVAAGLCLSLLALHGAAHADSLTLLTNTTDWLESTEYNTDNVNDDTWDGIAYSAVPSLSTFTVTPEESPYGPGTVPDATALASYEGVHFFRTTFTLPEFANLTGSVQTAVDNSIDIFINGNELAQYGQLDGFYNGVLRMDMIAGGGTVNGTEHPFSRIAPDINGFFHAGTNEVVLAVRNRLSPDYGHVTFRTDLSYAPTAAVVPEAGTLALALPSLGMVGMVMLRRRKV